MEWRGLIRAPRDPEAELQAFLTRLASELAVHKHLIQAALSNHETDIYLYSSLEASTDGKAVDKAKAAFHECIERAGATSHLPGTDDDSWKTYVLERVAVEVRPLLAA